MTSVCLFIESENLAQAVDEFVKQLKVCAKLGETHLTMTVNTESNDLLISFHTHHQLMFFYVIVRFLCKLFSLRKNHQVVMIKRL